MKHQRPLMPWWPAKLIRRLREITERKVQRNFLPEPSPIAGQKFSVDRRMLLGAIGAASLIHTEAYGLILRGHSTVSTLFGPGPSWTGVAGSGGSPPWTDPTRTTAKSVIRPTNAFPMRATANTMVGVAADAGSLAGVTGGIASVQAWCEGNSVTLPPSAWRTYVDANGNSKLLFDNAVLLNIVGAQTLHAEGSFNLYYYATPNDPSMQSRLIGPYTVRVSATQFDGTLTVGASGKDKTTVKAALDQAKTNGWAWPNIVLTDATAYPMNTVTTTLANPTGWATLNTSRTASFTGYVTANVLTVTSVASGTINVGDTVGGGGLQLNSAIATYGTGGTTGTGGVGTYALIANSYSLNTFPVQTTGSAGSPLSFIANVTATLGDYANNTCNMHYDGLCYRGVGLKVDQARLTYSLTWVFVIPLSSTGYFWLDGVDFFCGQTTASPATGFTFGAGGGATFKGAAPANTWVGVSSGTLGVTSFAGFYVTDCFKHDMYNGIEWATLARGNYLDQTASQGFENNYCTIHNYVNQNGPYLPGLRIPVNAFTMTASVGTVVQFEKTGTNGNSGNFNIYVDSSTPTYTLACTTSSATPPTLLSDVVNWINGTLAGTGGVFVTGFAATLQDTTNARVAAYLSMPDIVPSAAIVKRALVVGQPFQLVTIFDAHTDVFVQENAMENVMVQFNQAAGTTLGQFMFVDRPAACADVIYQNNIGQDRSLSFVYGTATASITGTVMTVTGTPTCAIQSFGGATIVAGAGVTAGAAITSQSTPTAGETWGGAGRYNLSLSSAATGSITATLKLGSVGPMGVGGPNTASNQSHLVFRRNTNDGDPAVFASTYLVNPDLYCIFSQNAFESMSWGGTPQSAQQATRNVLRLGTDISPFTAIPQFFSGPAGLGGASPTTMYNDPLNDNVSLINRLKPILGGPLLLPDATYAGALLPDGTFNLAA